MTMEENEKKRVTNTKNIKLLNEKIAAKIKSIWES